jgi:hypothetical protein
MWQNNMIDRVTNLCDLFGLGQRDGSQAIQNRLR